jgi:alkylation response protein AidB-like acyl-CoA dehydrogenase
MDQREVREAVAAVGERFAGERRERQGRTTLDRADFDALGAAGYLLTGVPEAAGGLWAGPERTTRLTVGLLRSIARGDSSVALVSAMHPAVLSYWLAAPEPAGAARAAWRAQVEDVTGRAADGDWWGTITSEPGSGGDITRSRATAVPDGEDGWLVSGAKHFGSGLGVMDWMVTTACPEGEESADWFFISARGLPDDGGDRARLVARWDGHGMAATNSHAMAFAGYPATRMAPGSDMVAVSRAAGPFIGCLFTAVVAGIVDIAMETARERLRAPREPLGPYQQVEWANAENEAWLIEQALEGMIRAVETKPAPLMDVLRGKMVCSSLAESVLTRLSRAIGGATFSRSSPFGTWFEDVRALGFLRPPWNLAYDQLIAGV